MKKIVLTMTLIAGVVAGAMTLSAFSKPTKTESVLEITASPVWQGYARQNGAGGRYDAMMSGRTDCYIRVYPTDNSCGAYYAVTVSDGREGDVHYTVKNNPDYDYRCQEYLNVAYYSHYITIGTHNFFFKM